MLHLKRITLTLLLTPALVIAAPKHDYLAVVRAYADAMIEHARDHYGSESSPLFAVTLDRQTMSLPVAEVLENLAALPRKAWGIRPHDRMLSGANPMHDENLYQVLYALSDLTGEPRYAAEADAALKWFFDHAQSPATGLMAWGEHIGWDFRTEQTIKKNAGNTHEFYRPWVLWDRTYKLAPDAAARFARGLWDHQIKDHQTGDFSRHADWSRHGPHGQNQYPRHGGFYIATWARAYKQTRDPVFLQAIDVLMGFYERHRSPQTGAIPAEIGNPRSKGKLLWPQSTVSLAIDLWDAADGMPDDVARRMHDMARGIDRVFIALPHELAPDGRGFVTQSHVDTLKAVDVRNKDHHPFAHLWADGYGESTDAKIANMLILRDAQVKDAGYRPLILAAADRYMTTEPRTDYPIYPAALGDVIELMLSAYQLTGDQRYMDRAVHFADRSIDMFFDDTCALPRASTMHDHYEAITRADTLVMSLLKLWVKQHRPEAQVRLIWNDR